MAGEQVYVAHAPDDLALVRELFSSVGNVPFGVHLALEGGDAGRDRTAVEGRISDADVVVAVVPRGERNAWVEQEIGYAVATETPVVPLYDEPSSRGGFVADVDGIAVDRTDLPRTVFELLGELRDRLEPLGTLSTPNWYASFACTVPDCTASIRLEIESDQPKLWKRHERGDLLQTVCDDCGSRYRFDPATIGFVGREIPAK